jgi:hypothetical protein
MAKRKPKTDSDVLGMISQIIANKVLIELIRSNVISYESGTLHVKQAQRLAKTVVRPVLRRYVKAFKE